MNSISDVKTGLELFHTERVDGLEQETSGDRMCVRATAPEDHKALAYQDTVLTLHKQKI